MHEGHGTSGFHTPAACCLRGFPSESMPFTSLLQNIYSKPHSAAQSRSADYKYQQRLFPAVYQTSSPAAASHAAMEPANQCSVNPAHKPFIRKMSAAEHNHLAHAAAERHDPAPPLLRHVFPRKELDVRPSEEKRKARYDEQDSQKDIDILHNRSHLSVIRFIRPFPGTVSQPAQAGKPAQQDRDRGKPDQGSDPRPEPKQHRSPPRQHAAQTADGSGEYGTGQESDPLIVLHSLPHLQHLPACADYLRQLQCLAHDPLHNLVLCVPD